MTFDLGAALRGGLPPGSVRRGRSWWAWGPSVELGRTRVSRMQGSCLCPSLSLQSLREHSVAISSMICVHISLKFEIISAQCHVPLEFTII